MSLINTNVLKEWVENWFMMNRNYHPYSKSNNIPISELYDILERMPKVDSEPVKHGYWIKINDDGLLWECSNCGDRACCRGNYCSNCGCKMDEKTTYEIEERGENNANR